MIPKDKGRLHGKPGEISMWDMIKYTKNIIHRCDTKRIHRCGKNITPCLKKRIVLVTKNARNACSPMPMWTTLNQLANQSGLINRIKIWGSKGRTGSSIVSTISPCIAVSITWSPWAWRGSGQEHAESHLLQWRGLPHNRRQGGIVWSDDGVHQNNAAQRWPHARIFCHQGNHAGWRGGAGLPPGNAQPGVMTVSTRITQSKCYFSAKLDLRK